MAEDSVHRRLAAILAADVVGYSRMMGEDEAGTLGRLKELRREMFEPKTKQYHGRIFKTAGDGALVEFKSAVDAVNCAVDIQRALAKRGDGVAAEIQLRIGVSLGDVIVEGGDLYGNGVNVAARMEGLAEAGGICISGNVHEHVRSATEFGFDDLGQQEVKNIASPVHAYRVHLGSKAQQQTDAGAPLPNKPSIAVLPFNNLSDDVEQDYFADGLAEDVITALSHLSDLLVIARNSSFAYKGKPIDIRQVGRELGVLYALEGSVRKVGDRIRVTAQLVNTQDGNHRWAERYDRTIADIFSIQDELTKEIVTSLRLQLTDGEQARMLLRATNNVDAWSHFVQGMEHFAHFNPADIQQARECYERATRADPEYSLAFAYIGWTHYIDVRMGFSASPAESQKLLEKAASRALEIDPDSPHGHGARACTLAMRNEFEAAIQEAEIAVYGNPNDAQLRMILGRLLIFASRSADGVRQVREAMRLHPLHPAYYFGVMANGLSELGQDQEAIRYLKLAIGRDANYFAGHLRLASLYGLIGRIDEAGRAAAEALRINPRFTLARASSFYSSVDPKLTARFIEGLRLAGFRAD